MEEKDTIAKSAIHRLEIAVLTAQERVEAQDYGKAYETLNDVEKWLAKARTAVNDAMIYKGWRI